MFLNKGWRKLIPALLKWLKYVCYGRGVKTSEEIDIFVENFDLEISGNRPRGKFDI
jgi:hypothetical protein